MNIRAIRFIAFATLCVLVVLGAMLANHWFAINQRLQDPAIRGSRVVANTPLDSTQATVPSAFTQPKESTFNPAHFQAPPLAYRPWIRWWWPTPNPERKIIQTGLQQILDWGLGGATIEITAQGLAPEDRLRWSHQQLTPGNNELGRTWELLGHEAFKRGLQLDWTPAHGWPLGMSNLPASQQLQTLTFGETYVLGGKTIDISPPAPTLPASYLFSSWMEQSHFEQEHSVSWLPDSAQLLALFAARISDHQRNSLPFVLTDHLDFFPDSIFQIDSYLDEAGRIHWDAPPGYWEILAIYEQPAGQHPLFGLSGAADWVPNALDGDLLTQQLKAETRHFTSDTTDGATTWRNINLPSPAYFTEWIFDQKLSLEFSKHRGYNLTPWLPVLSIPGADHALFNHFQLERKASYQIGEADDRVRNDFWLTRSDYLLDSVQPRLTALAQEQGLGLREHPFGAHMDLIRAAGQSQLPSVSQSYMGQSLGYQRQVISGAWLYQRPLVTAEVLNLPGEAGSQTVSSVLSLSRNAFLAGANQVEWQGWAMGQDLSGQYADEGWHPGASPYFEAGVYGGQWFNKSLAGKYASIINREVSRMQYTMQLGSPAVDLYVYYPFLGFPQGDFIENSQYFPPPYFLDKWLKWASPTSDPRHAWLNQAQPALEMLEGLGYTWAWINDDWIQQASLTGPALVRDSLLVDEILLLDAPQMPLRTLDQLIGLHRSGGKVIAYGQVPKRVPGYLNHKDQDSVLQILIRELTSAVPISTTEDLRNALISRPPAQPVGYTGYFPFLRHMRRSLADGSQLVLLSNTQDQDRYFELDISEEYEAIYWLSPRTGLISVATTTENRRLPGYLGPLDYRILYCAKEEKLPDSVVTPRTLLDRGYMGEERVGERQITNWQFIAVGGQDTFRRMDTTLFDWQEQPNLAFNATEGLYTTNISLGDTIPNRAYILDLGKVEGVAEVIVNTQHIETLLSAPYRVDLTDFLNPGTNTLEIWLAVPHRNISVGKALQGTPGYSPYRELPMVPNGLLGPVRMLEINLRDSLP